VVKKNENDDNYTVVCGRNRLLALRCIYENSRDEKYLKIKG